MPEILEVETYRALAAPLVGATVRSMWLDPHFADRSGLPITLGSDFAGQKVVGIRRIGKLLLVDLDEVTFGIRFAMTGRLLLDGDNAIGALAYGPKSQTPRWIRWTTTFDDRRVLALDDSRRFGRLVLNPDESLLGPDALGLSKKGFAAALQAAGNGRAIKAVLLDQSVIAGLGNLLVDEQCWRCGIDPARHLGDVSDAEVEVLYHSMVEVLCELGVRGGSHTGDLMGERTKNGRCPRDGTVLVCHKVGGRPTYSCPLHQY